MMIDRDAKAAKGKTTVITRFLRDELGRPIAIFESNRGQPYVAVARWLDFYDLAISEQGKPAPKKEEKKSPKQKEPRDEFPSELEC